MKNFELRKQEPLSDHKIEKLAKKNNVDKLNICCICGDVIQVMSFKNTGVCCELHRKARDGDIRPWQGGALNP